MGRQAVPRRLVLNVRPAAAPVPPPPPAQEPASGPEVSAEEEAELHAELVSLRAQIVAVRPSYTFLRRAAPPRLPPAATLDAPRARMSAVRSLLRCFTPQARDARMAMETQASTLELELRQNEGALGELQKLQEARTADPSGARADWARSARLLCGLRVYAPCERLWLT